MPVIFHATTHCTERSLPREAPGLFSAPAAIGLLKAVGRIDGMLTVLAKMLPGVSRFAFFELIAMRCFDRVGFFVGQCRELHCARGGTVIQFRIAHPFGAERILRSEDFSTLQCCHRALPASGSSRSATGIPGSFVGGILCLLFSDYIPPGSIPISFAPGTSKA